MQSIMKFIQQRVLYYTELNEFKKAKNLKFLNLFQIFVSKFSSNHNTQNRVISNLMQTIIDWNNDTIEENNNKGERRYRLNEDNRKLKKHKKSDDYEDGKEKNKKEKNNNSEMNDIKEIIQISD